MLEVLESFVIQAEPLYGVKDQNYSLPQQSMNVWNICLHSRLGLRCLRLIVGKYIPYIDCWG